MHLFMLLVVNWKKVFLSFNHEEVKASSGAVKMLPELNEMASMAMAERWHTAAALHLERRKKIPPYSLKIRF